MEIQRMLSDLKDNIEKKNIANANISFLLKSITGTISPYKIGDIVPAQSYSHKKSQCRITHISLTQELDEMTVYATILKKDGSDSSYTTKWRSYQDMKLKEAIEQLQ